MVIIQEAETGGTENVPPAEPRVSSPRHVSPRVRIGLPGVIAWEGNRLEPWLFGH
jgi:hypothetical protein